MILIGVPLIATRFVDLEHRTSVHFQLHFARVYLFRSSLSVEHGCGARYIYPIRSLIRDPILGSLPVPHGRRGTCIRCYQIAGHVKVLHFSLFTPSALTQRFPQTFSAAPLDRVWFSTRFGGTARTLETAMRRTFGYGAWPSRF